jgi:hypothetical protein
VVSQTFSRPAVRDDGVTEIEVDITVNSWGSPAQTFGPPESCDPGEGMEVEITDCWLAVDSSRPDAPKVTLTEAERDRIELDFMENPPEPDYGDDY